MIGKEEEDFMLSRKIILTCIVILSTVPSGLAETAGFRERVTLPVEESISIRRTTQKKETRWRDDKQALTDR
ncbi:MAG: hypothetical protein P8X55_20105, partial [Desulfosarcinaceae bacterium]